MRENPSLSSPLEFSFIVVSNVKADNVAIVYAVELDGAACRTARHAKVARGAHVPVEDVRTINLGSSDKVDLAITLFDDLREDLTAVVAVIAIRFPNRERDRSRARDGQALLGGRYVNVSSDWPSVQSIVSTKVRLAGLKFNGQGATECEQAV